MPLAAATAQALGAAGVVGPQGSRRQRTPPEHGAFSMDSRRSGPPELAFQILVGEQQRRGPPVRAMVCVLDKIPLGDQGGDLLRC